jgi:quinolinate synthase
MNTATQTMYEQLSAKLHKVVPDVELRYKAELAVEVNRLKVERNAVILGHNYMEPALFHSIPDFVGDSLGLSRQAAKTDKEMIVFCGVEFMAETAKILNPEKTVLIPSQKAGCSLAASITAENVCALKAQFPSVPVVTYVNTYADVKAESDICCTSGNAEAVVNSLDSDTIIFLPDEYLAKNVARETGKKIIFPSPFRGEGLGVRGEPTATFIPVSSPFKGEGGSMIIWHGRCEVHEKFTVDDINNVRAQFPEVAILAHPECSPEVVEASDFAGSTNAMIQYIEETDAPQFLLLTECAMGDNIIGAYPDKEILRLCSVRCPHMNQITLEAVRDALLHTQYVVEVPEEIRLRAANAVERMIAIG